MVEKNMLVISHLPAEPVRLSGSQPRLLSWKRPFFPNVVNCDGSFKERSQECGYGIIVRDFLGRMTLAKAKHFPKVELTNDDVEYGTMVLMVEMLAIRDGLRLTRRLNISQVEVQSDSKTAIRIIRGLSECPKECLGLLSEIMFEACFFLGLEFEFVYREQNRAADFLSKF
ncbi:hypothetical protein CASFOL_012859 [Castilleja foliolosa]|uniref:RNase H type-1 domain-containing protein n=1 Tax=Castilleja foliolosa TaxID=1961234 RepID=A0ABD3DJK3_9LAMI